LPCPSLKFLSGRGKATGARSKYKDFRHDSITSQAARTERFLCPQLRHPSIGRDKVREIHS
jgi:hypothetical protein